MERPNFGENETAYYYVRDASGNVMAVYKHYRLKPLGYVPMNPVIEIRLQELHIYGSNRIGMILPNTLLYAAGPGPESMSGGFELDGFATGTATWVAGNKRYELGNHLGNVLSVITDRKLGVGSTPGNPVTHHLPDIKTASDYYPFGWAMPGRKLNMGGYRYGFNDQEMDNEVKGAGISYAFEYRMYDARAGRFLSVDPISRTYAHVTPYNFAENRVIDGVDLWGLQYVDNGKRLYSIQMGQTWLRTNSFQGGIDAHGINYIGTQIPIQQVEFSGEKFPLYRNSFNKSLQWQGENLGKLYSVAVRTKSGNYLDNRYNSTKNYVQAAKKGNTLGKVGLALTALDLGKSAYNTVKSYDESKEFHEQRQFVRKSWNDVKMALNQGIIDDKYQNINDLSSIANFIFSGGDNFGEDESLRNLSIKISKEISKNYKNEITKKE